MTLIVVLFSMIGWAATEIPVCDGIGTRSQGWYYQGQLIRTVDGGIAWDNSCQEKVVKCGAVGTRGEGYYVYSIKNPTLIGWTQCSDSDQKPECGLIGTRSQGWTMDGTLMNTMNGTPAWDNRCDQELRGAGCWAVGSRSEGWYAFDLVQEKLLFWADCAE